MYNIDWPKFIKRQLRPRLSKPVRVNWIENLTWPIRALNQTFVDTYLGLKYKADHNGQICYLEHALNDMFDPIDREIYIDNVIDQFNSVWIWNKAEGQSPPILTRKWNSGYPYAANNLVREDDTIYVALGPTTGDLPSASPSKWAVVPDLQVKYLFRKDDPSVNDFIVMVPDDIIFDQSQMRALVDYYKTGGKRYTIELFTP